MKYYAEAGKYEPFLRKCVAEKLWIKEMRQWWGPYDWAWKFSVVYLGADYVPQLGNPYELIAEARAKDLTPSQAQAVDRFEARVNEYYSSGKDQKLIQTIEGRVWVV